MGPGPPQNVLPGQAAGFNAPPGHMMHNMYGHASGGPPFANPALARPPYMGPMEGPHLTPAEAYRQQHEVTATVSTLTFLFIDHVSVHQTFCNFLLGHG